LASAAHGTIALLWLFDDNTTFHANLEIEWHLPKNSNTISWNSNGQPCQFVKVVEAFEEYHFVVG